VPLELFVYGTLMPGHLRWPLLAGSAGRALAAPGWVGGRLYDTGEGWPSAVFGPDDAGGDAPSRPVPGWHVSLEGEPAELLRSLDAMEGVSDPPRPGTDPFRRVEVGVHRGTGDGTRRAWAYEATSIGAGWVPIACWSGRPER
jgi:gamma-glutamylcyclotransferase (GGCT)/AIG2-like uncharacterized protein YtfP